MEQETHLHKYTIYFPTLLHSNQNLLVEYFLCFAWLSSVQSQDHIRAPLLESDIVDLRYLE